MKLEIGQLFEYNCTEWVLEKLECGNGVMSARFIEKDKVEMRIFNELAVQQGELDNLRNSLIIQSERLTRFQDQLDNLLRR